MDNVMGDTPRISAASTGVSSLSSATAYDQQMVMVACFAHFGSSPLAIVYPLLSS
jgi:hypothetical protein